MARGKDGGGSFAADKWAVTGGRVRASRGEEGRRREAEEGDERGRTTTKPMGEGRTEKEMIFSRGVGAPRAATAARNQACGTEGAIFFFFRMYKAKHQRRAGLISSLNDGGDSGNNQGLTYNLFQFRREPSNSFWFCATGTKALQTFCFEIVIC